MMNKVFGGTVHRKSVREDGVFSIALDSSCSLFRYTSLYYCRFQLYFLSSCVGMGIVKVLTVLLLLSILLIDPVL